jgi:hypothetical protein
MSDSTPATECTVPAARPFAEHESVVITSGIEPNPWKPCVGVLPTTHRDSHSGYSSRYFSFRIDGVKVIPSNNPSGVMKRLTVWPQGSFLFLTSIRYSCDSSSTVACSTLSTSNSSQAWGAGISLGQESWPKQDCAACESGHKAGRSDREGVQQGDEIRRHAQPRPSRLRDLAAHRR